MNVKDVAKVPSDTSCRPLSEAPAPSSDQNDKASVFTDLRLRILHRSHRRQHAAPDVSVQ